MDKKTWKKWLAAAGVPGLVALMVLTGGDEPDPNRVRFSHMNKTQKDSVRIAELKKAKPGDEIVSMRTETARIRKIDNRHQSAMITTVPQNYLDPEDSIYKPIDLTVKEVSALAKLNPLRKFDKYIDAGNYRATWKDEKRHNYTFFKGDYSVNFTSLNDTLKVKTETKPLTTGIKQTHTIIDTTLRKLRWTIETNADPRIQADGRIQFIDFERGASIFCIEPPTATDAKNTIVPITVSLSGDTLIYTIIPSTGMTWPITVDPTTEMYTTTLNSSYSSKDVTYLTGRNQTTADLVEYYSRIGQEGAGEYWIYRAYYMFDTSSLPNEASVITATLWLGNVSQDSDETGFDLHIVNGTMNAPAATTWFNDFDNWASSGTYSVTDLITPVASSTWAVDDSVKVTLNAAGLAAISLTDTTKYVVLSSKDIIAEAPPSGKQYLSIGVVDNHECYLQITYTSPPIAPTDFANTGATTTTLSYSWTDNSDDEDGFKIKNAGGDTSTVGTYDAEAEVGTVEGLGINTRHGLEVRAFNADGWSDPSDSVVTYTLANPPNSWNFTNIGATGTVDVGFGVNGNPAWTEFAVRDSTNQKWVQTDGTLGETIDWDTYATWDAVTITDPGVTGTVRYSVMARNGDNINTAEVTGTLYVYKYPPPTSFALSNPTTTNIDAEWTLSGAGVDSLSIMHSPENTIQRYVPLGRVNITIHALTPNTLYTFFIRADSSGVKGDSNTDSLYTLTVPPTAWDFTETSSLEITPSFSGGSNPAGTLFAIRDSLRHVWLDASGDPVGTKTWRTEAQWEAITITTGLIYGETYLLGIVGKNGDDVETTYLWGSVTLASLSTTINAIEAGGLVSIPQTSNYDLFTPNLYIYDTTDSTDYEGARNYPWAETATPTLTIGRRLSGSIYSTYRGFVTFNTSSIPDDADIDSVKVKFKMTSNNSIAVGDSLYVIQSSGFTGAQTNYFHLFTGWLDSGAYTGIVKLAVGEDVSALSPGDSTNVFYKLNTAGLAAINKTGNTEFVLMTERDRSSTAPTTNEYITLDVDYIYMQVFYDSYNYSRDVATGTVVDTLKIGQYKITEDIDAIYRSFMTFPMPDGATSATAGSLFVYAYAESIGTDFDINIVGANEYRPTLDTTDFVNFDGRQAFGTAHTGTVLNETWNATDNYAAGWDTLILNQAGLNSIGATAGDSLAIALLSSKDFSATAPTTYESVMFLANNDAPYLSITYETTAPSNFALTPTSTSEFTATWQDNTDDEDGFRIIDALTYDYIDSTGNNTETINLSGYTPNQLKQMKVQVKGGASDLYVSSADSAYTFANTPGDITLTLIDGIHIKFVLDTNSNPVYTKFCILDSLTGKFVYSVAGLCTLGTEEYWATYSTFGGGNGDTLFMNPGQVAVLKAKARNTSQ